MPLVLARSLGTRSLRLSALRLQKRVVPAAEARLESLLQA